QKTPVTDSWYNANSATFSDDGKYLMMASARDFRAVFAEERFDAVYRDMERIYFVTLSKDTESPTAPRSDEVGKKREKQKEKEEKEKQEKEKSPSPSKPDQKSSPSDTK